MEKNINLAKILNGKPVNTKLWSPLFGDVYTSSTCSEDTIIVVNHHAESSSFYNNGKYFNHAEAELLLFPSKEMRDWSKFAWKKGDVLIMDGYRVVFDKWLNDDYTRFNAVHLITSIGGYIDKPLQNRYSPISNFITRNWRKMTDAETKIYMDSLERECGGKLNLETLEIEKQPEFKDGDIVVAEEDNYYDKVIFIAAIKDAIVSKVLINVRYEDYEVHYNEYRFGHNRSLRLATDSEKQQLFEALAKENKAWDTEKKQIVELKPKIEFKPFDKVVVRDTEYSTWCADLFSHIDEDYRYACVGATWSFCIPYNEETAKLIGTINNVEG